MATDWVSTRGRAIERSAVRERPIRPRTPDAPFASQSVDNKTTAERWWPGAGVFGYALHGFALLLFALWAAWHFGQVFWFFSLVSAALGLSSLHDAYASCSAAKSRTGEFPR